MFSPPDVARDVVKGISLPQFLQANCQHPAYASYYKKSLQLGSKAILPVNCHLANEHMWVSGVIVTAEQIRTLHQMGCKAIVTFHFSRLQDERKINLDNYKHEFTDADSDLASALAASNIESIHMPMPPGGIPTRNQINQLKAIYQRYANEHGQFILLQDWVGRHVVAAVSAINALCPNDTFAWTCPSQYLMQKQYIQSYLQSDSFPYPSEQMEHDMLTNLWQSMLEFKQDIPLGLYSPPEQECNESGDLHVTQQLCDSWSERMNAIFYLALSAGCSDVAPELKAQHHHIKQVVQDNLDKYFARGWTLEEPELYKKLFMVQE